MQSRLGISRSQNIPEKLKSMRNAFTAFSYLEFILREKCYRTEKTTFALIALNEAKEQILTQIKNDHVEDVASEAF